MNYEPGTKLRVELTDKRVFEGVVLPGEGLVLKLADGYNIGLDEENVASVKTLSKLSGDEEVRKPSVHKDSSLPRVDILHTGGTIASKVDYSTGGVSNLFSPEELLGMYPELQEVACVEATFVANMSSDDMRFAHYNKLIRAVQEALKNDPVGIVVTHGTDTLHYSAAALHYALRGVPVPVVLVGSQRSSDRGSSDAATNLQAAVRYCVSEQASNGVFVCMHGSADDTSVAVLPGVHARKLHTSRRDAFRAVNSRVVAQVRGDLVEEVSSWGGVEESFSVQLFDEELRIGMLYAHPQFFAEELAVYDGFDGLVVLGTGLGHLPISSSDEFTKEHEAVASAVKELARKLPVVMSSQCVHGRVSLQVYSPARRLQEAGVLGHGLALTAEALFCKLAFLLSADKDPSLISEDFGDLIARTEEASYDE